MLTNEKSHTETVYTFCIQNCTRCIQLMYTKCIQNVYKMYTTFRQTFVYILYRKSKELCQLNFVYKMYRYKRLSKCGIHFVCKYCVYILYTKCIQKFVGMLYVGYILYTNILDTFCIHQLWSIKSVHRKYYVDNLYTKFIQNVYTNNCMENESLISTYFDPVIVHFLVNHFKQLRLETCWLIMGGTYQIKGLLGYIFH